MSSMDYPVTVVMAAYNSAHCVGRAIESLLAQTFEDWNLIVVDDHSTDNTLEVLNGYANRDRRIIVMPRDENRRPAHCRNVAISASSSPLIAIIDSDDVWLPDKLRLQMEFMKRHPETDVLGTAAYYVLPDEPQSGLVVCLPESHEDLVSVIYRCCPFIHSSVIYTRRFIERANGYRTELLRGEDADLWLRTYRDSRFHNLREPLIEYVYRKVPPFRDALFAVKLYYEAAARERRLAKYGWYIVRPLIADLAIRLRLMPSHPRGLRSECHSSDERPRND